MTALVIFFALIPVSIYYVPVLSIYSNSTKPLGIVVLAPVFINICFYSFQVFEVVFTKVFPEPAFIAVIRI